MEHSIIRSNVKIIPHNTASPTSHCFCYIENMGHFTREIESPRPFHFKHSHCGKGGVGGPISLRTTLEGPTEYGNARGM